MGIVSYIPSDIIIAVHMLTKSQGKFLVICYMEAGELLTNLRPEQYLAGLEWRQWCRKMNSVLGLPLALDLGLNCL